MVDGAAAPVALFDLDNTLLDRAQAFASWAQSFFDRHGVGDVGAVAQLVAADRDGQASKTELFADVAARYGLSDSVPDLVGRYRDEIVGFLQLDPQVRSGLVALRDAGWGVGIVTNGSSAQERKIRRSGLVGLVDGWAISEVEGVRKPDPELFATALVAVGQRRQVNSRDQVSSHDQTDERDHRRRVWMIGDHPVADIGGGARFGASTIWISRGASWTMADYQPDLVVGGAAEAIQHLLERGPAQQTSL